MNLLFINLFGTVLVIALPASLRGGLSQRLTALRDWPTEKNYASRD